MPCRSTMSSPRPSTLTWMRSRTVKASSAGGVSVYGRIGYRFPGPPQADSCPWTTASPLNPAATPRSMRRLRMLSDSLMTEPFCGRCGTGLRRNWLGGQGRHEGFEPVDDVDEIDRALADLGVRRRLVAQFGDEYLDQPVQVVVRDAHREVDQGHGEPW